MHFECYEFIAQRSNIDRSLDYLWVVTAWRTPWGRAPKFRLEEKVVKSVSSVFNHVNIPRIRSLPPEILQIIYEYSATSIIWRFNTASEVIQRLTIPSSDHLLSIPLHKVSAWKRSGQPRTTETAHNLPVVRLTIDSQGIREVERLPGNPPFRRWRTDDFVFVTLNHEFLDGAVAHFKVTRLCFLITNTARLTQEPSLDRCVWNYRRHVMEFRLGIRQLPPTCRYAASIQTVSATLHSLKQSICVRLTASLSSSALARFGIYMPIHKKLLVLWQPINASLPDVNGQLRGSMSHFRKRTISLH